MKKFSGVLFMSLILVNLGFANNLFYITKFGAKADGKTNNAKAIQKAIDAAAFKGGVVVVPAGEYMSGTIFLKTNTELHLQLGAKLIASPFIKDYSTMTWGHHEDRTPWHFIVAKGQKNIAISGKGEIYGNGPAFRNPNRKNNFSFFTEIEFRPSPLIEIQDCQQVLIQDILVSESPGWTLHLFDTDNAKVRGITIENSLFGPNSDGIDITGSREVIISDCNIKAGDDAIAVKTTEDSRSCERITVTNCIFETNCVSVRVGFESRKDISDITVSNCVIKNTSRAIDIRTIEGGNIRNVIVTGVVGNVDSGWAVDRVIEVHTNRIDNPYDIAIKEHPNYGKAKPVEKAGVIENVHFSNMHFRTSGRILVSAISEGLIDNISFININLTYNLLEDVHEIGKVAQSVGFARNLSYVRSQNATFVVENAANIRIQDYVVKWPVYPVPDDCLLLTSTNRLFNKWFFEGNEPKIKSGEMRVEYKVFAFKNAKNVRLENTTAVNSENGAEYYSSENSILLK
jgi:hypothetical protein